MKVAPRFKAKIGIININPFVFLPENALEYLFAEAGKTKGVIPVSMSIDGHTFKQTLVRFRGAWRLYLNKPMRKAAGKDVGDCAVFQVRYDPLDRKLNLPSKLRSALSANPDAYMVFKQIRPSLQQEIIRYIVNLKTEESKDRNIKRAMNFLVGKERFVGRDKPE